MIPHHLHLIHRHCWIPSNFTMGSSHQTDHFLFNIIELSKCKYTYTYMSYIHKITIYILWLLFIYWFFYLFIYLYVCVCVWFVNIRRAGKPNWEPVCRQPFNRTGKINEPCKNRTGAKSVEPNRLRRFTHEYLYTKLTRTCSRVGKDSGRATLALRPPRQWKVQKGQRRTDKREPAGALSCVAIHEPPFYHTILKQICEGKQDRHESWELTWHLSLGRAWTDDCESVVNTARNRPVPNQKMGAFQLHDAFSCVSHKDPSARTKRGWKCPMESTEFQPRHQPFVGNPMTFRHTISKKYNSLTATLLLQQAQRNDHMVWDQETVYCCPSPGHVWHPAPWLQSPQRPQRHICGLQNFLLPTTSRLLQNGAPQPLSHPTFKKPTTPDTFICSNPGSTLTVPQQTGRDQDWQRLTRRLQCALMPNAHAIAPGHPRHTARGWSWCFWRMVCIELFHSTCGRGLASIFFVSIPPVVV